MKIANTISVAITILVLIAIMVNISAAGPVQETAFRFGDWGSYNAIYPEIDFRDIKYFVGYNSDSWLYDNSIKLPDDLACEVLNDNDYSQTISTKEPLLLEQGYQLAVKSIDTKDNKVYVELTKNGQLVDSKVIRLSIDNAEMSDKTYSYKGNILGHMGIITIAVHFKNAFRGIDGVNIAVVDGVWQISTDGHNRCDLASCPAGTGLTCCSGLVCMPQQANPTCGTCRNQIEVNLHNPSAYSTIQEAVNNAQPCDTIKVAAGTYDENVRIDKSLAIKGAGAGNTIVNGEGKGSVFHIGQDQPDKDLVVYLSRITIENGKGSDDGGGIVNFGSLTVTYCDILNNIAKNNGGGISNAGWLRLETSNVSKNSAQTGGGGGIYQDSKEAETKEESLLNSVIYQNTAQLGGGIYSRGSTATASVTNCIINENEAMKNKDTNTNGLGGAIYNYNGRFTVIDSQLAKNHADMDGGGICNYYQSPDREFILRASDISLNRAGRNGGGICNFNGIMTITGSRITENNAAQDGTNCDDIDYCHGGGIYNKGNPLHPESFDTNQVYNNHPDDIYPSVMGYVPPLFHFVNKTTLYPWETFPYRIPAIVSRSHIEKP